MATAGAIVVDGEKLELDVKRVSGPTVTSKTVSVTAIGDGFRVWVMLTISVYVEKEEVDGPAVVSKTVSVTITGG